CHLLGDYLESVSKDFATAAKVYQKNCDENNYGHSCFKYGSYLYRGKGCTQDFETAVNYFRKGCDLNHPKSCLLSGVAIAKRHQDYAKALTYLEKGCNMKCSESCHHASGFYLSGQHGTEKNMKKAFEFGLKGCDLGVMQACANVSQMYARGDGVDQNLELAEKYKKIAIDIQKQHTEQYRQIKFGE
ncbi:hypothetical protein CHUAL_009403, partial [Chamberlinius hualienensis]